MLSPPTSPDSVSWESRQFLETPCLSDILLGQAFEPDYADHVGFSLDMEVSQATNQSHQDAFSSEASIFNGGDFSGLECDQMTPGDDAWGPEKFSCNIQPFKGSSSLSSLPVRPMNARFGSDEYPENYIPDSLFLETANSFVSDSSNWSDFASSSCSAADGFDEPRSSSLLASKGKISKEICHEVPKIKQESNEKTVADMPGSNHQSTSDTASGCPSCGVCHESFKRPSELEAHAKEKGHKPFACLFEACSARFSRRDALKRHHDVHTLSTLYPCTEAGCEKYRGNEAFKRRDHLIQHLRKVHSIPSEALHPRFCPYPACRYSGSAKFFGFESRRSYIFHMRQSHGEGTFDCREDNCNRIGKKGFARRRDLDLHRRRVHQRLE